ncbi:MAG: 2,3-bisphosphoglycerate-independent phosphoglycerate mutase [Candidatus Tectomicrobia bacterium]|uniref:2,3-bisphosphoglycerate-independent phosphoglycerate mutase n=1 Tax=Tectimicrobiota bacterium TaxID=2528274 RepID=A0A932CMI0_UNCTE|nr:2,3-bisphosphoglycerate-independent phosphoglycerate mutase [Candidatus Tectomicrobia bacterium]
MDPAVLEELVIPGDTKIILVVLDGLGGLPVREKGGSELQVAHLPNLDRLAASSACGLLDPVGPGITPGSGPGHLALFGYDPWRDNIGRGVLSALGIDFPLQPQDVAARANFITVDEQGRIVDRRAGRIPDEINRRICRKLRENVVLPSDVEWFFEPEKEHRAVLILRGQGLDGEITDTDPQRTGVPPLEPCPLSPEAERAARLVKEFLSQVEEILADEERANMVLLRGFAQYRRFRSLLERFGLRSLALASYPMYRGVGRLLGMEEVPAVSNNAQKFHLLREKYEDYDFFFLHIKETDSRGEDGDFEGKVRALEEIDRLIPQAIELEPDVLVVTGDHSTPSLMKGHSWHPVPVLFHARYAWVDEVERFDELSCLRGSLGRQPAMNLMGLMLAHARRLTKYGA